MDPLTRLRCSSGVKAVAAVGLLALVLCAPALAKFKISIAVSDTTPAMDQRVVLGVRSERALAKQYRTWAKAARAWPRTARLLTTLADTYERFGRVGDFSAERLDID